MQHPGCCPAALADLLRGHVRSGRRQAFAWVLHRPAGCMLPGDTLCKTSRCWQGTRSDLCHHGQFGPLTQAGGPPPPPPPAQDPKGACHGPDENKLGWAATLCQQAASTDQARHGKGFFPSPQIFSDCNGDIHPDLSFQLNATELSTSPAAGSREGALLSLHTAQPWSHRYLQPGLQKPRICAKLSPAVQQPCPQGSARAREEGVQPCAAPQGAGALWGAGSL